MFMQAGFAMVEAGLCRVKNANHTYMMNFYGVRVRPPRLLADRLCHSNGGRSAATLILAASNLSTAST